MNVQVDFRQLKEAYEDGRLLDTVLALMKDAYWEGWNDAKEESE